MSFVGHASECWMAWDGAADESFYDVNAGGITFPHVGVNGNFLYFDGHVESLNCTEVDGRVGGGATVNGYTLGCVTADSRLLCNP